MNSNMNLDSLLKQMKVDIPDAGFTDRVMHRLEKTGDNAFDLDVYSEVAIEMGLIVAIVFALKSSLVQHLVDNFHLNLGAVGTIGIAAILGALFFVISNQSQLPNQN